MKSPTLDVSVNSVPVGDLRRAYSGVRGAVFRYRSAVPDEMGVSLTMPVRFDDYSSEHGLHPVFDMNLPEGALRAELKSRFSKAVGAFDDFSLLSVVGYHQLGRVTVSKPGEALNAPGTSVADLLAHDGAHGLFDDLLSEYAQYSGISGVQPKVLLRDSVTADMDKVTHRGATHILKAWGDEFQDLALNEYHCMLAAKFSGLKVPEFSVSANGKFFVVKRFDVDSDGKGFLGFEDFCLLTGRQSDEKYEGSYESLAKSIQAMVGVGSSKAALLDFFKIIALSSALKNGDAHLKNFGLLYSDASQASSPVLAPAFDLVTTTAYIKNDSMALLLGGSKAWPKRKALENFARVNCGLTSAATKDALHEVAEGVSLARRELAKCAADNRGFEPVASRMMSAWDEGVSRSLQSLDRPVVFDMAVDHAPGKI